MQRHVLQQLWQAAAALHRLKSLLKKQRLRGESGAAEGQTEITFTVWDYETTDYWKKLVEAFEAENPDIKVKVMDPPVPPTIHA